MGRGGGHGECTNRTKTPPLAVLQATAEVHQAQVRVLRTVLRARAEMHEASTRECGPLPNSIA